MMQVTNTISPLEINGERSLSVADARKLSVCSHWNYDDRVHLKFGDMDIVVPARQLEAAIENARNHR